MSRWWAPAGAHLGPDETDLERLQPGQDKRLDLGQYLLTVHRMGAAACEEAASGPIPDEFSFVERLAAARAVFAPPVVEAVSKSLGERAYADLLVRDVLDDAEQGALQVFRTAVAGGVPAAIAAQRAGMVYGVPPESLGSYLAVAKELRAHPAALTDAADRCLFQAVEKAVLEEMEAIEPEFEEVSKAPAAVLERQDNKTTPYYDARDILGRFAKPTEARRVSDVLAKPVGLKAETPRLSRVTRKVRQVRQARTPQQARQSVQQGQVQQAKVALTSIPKAQLEQMWVEAAKIPPPPPPAGGGDWGEGDLLTKLPGGEYDRLADMGEMRLVMGSADYNEFLSRAPEVGGTKLFRIGHLTRRLGSGALQKPGVNHDANVSEQSGHFFSETGYKGPNIKIVPADELAYAETRQELEEVVEKYAVELAKEYVEDERNVYPGDPLYERFMNSEIDNIMGATHYDEDGNRVLVHTFPDAKNAPLIEFVIPEQAWEVRGSHGPNSGTGEIDLDPNQVYKIAAQAPDVRIDVKNGAIIRQYAILPVDPEDYDVEKAATTLLRPDLATTPYYDARDITGRFAAAPVAISSALEQKTQRTQRTQRKQRAERKQQQAAQVSQARVKGGSVQQARVKQAQVQVQKLQQAQIQRGLLENPPANAPGYREIVATRKYTVMDADRFNKLVGGEGPIGWDAQDELLGEATAGRNLFDALEEHAKAYEGEGRAEWVKRKVPGVSMVMQEEVAFDVDQLMPDIDMDNVNSNTQGLKVLAAAAFNEWPEAQSIMLVKNGPSQEVGVYVDLRDFSEEGKDAKTPLVMVEQDDDLDPDRPLVAQPLGETKMTRLIPPKGAEAFGEIRSEDFAFHEEFNADDPVVLSQPIVIHNPRLRHYRLTNS